MAELMGATNQGVFHEALNLAAAWELPVVFFCENNVYAEMTPIAQEVKVPRMAAREVMQCRNGHVELFTILTPSFTTRIEAAR